MYHILKSMAELLNLESW